MNKIEQQKQLISELSEKDEQLLDTCLESSSYGSNLGGIQRVISNYEVIKNKAKEEGNNIVEYHCNERIWFWSRRLQYITGEDCYIAPSLSGIKKSSSSI